MNAISEEMKEHFVQHSYSEIERDQRMSKVYYLTREDFISHYATLSENQIYEQLAKYAEHIKNKMLPSESEHNIVTSKHLLLKRKTRPWFKIAGAHVQGEVHVTKDLETQLHGRAIVVMPNYFVIAGTFD